MELGNVKHSSQPAALETEHRCVVCSARISSGVLCEACAHRELTSDRYAELFWDEV